MKFIGKLFVITALLVGFNIPSLAYASVGAAENKALAPSSKATAKGDVIPNIPVKTPHDKMTVTATPNSSVKNSQSYININSADAEQLAQFLSGIGRKKAEAIVNYREQFGLFTDAEQLLEVPGVVVKQNWPRL
ncbi:ComEA family DNA-binding protein [Yersinia hibernica]|uniref:Transporter n=1 Tax=Yersinia enterocolitica LC20 TaxID=1443113 RepID=A0A7U4K0C2_YEREN|nr:helix-hairpin-helix domain-containing protein [Yersinia hibernica]AHM72648.2 transporter [Yersinia hibernica]